MNEEFVLKEDEPTATQPSLSNARPRIVDATIRQPASEHCLQDDPGEAAKRDDIQVGLPLPLGVYGRGEGVNFAFISRNATRARLELFDHPEDAQAARMIDLDALHHRTGDVWHVWIAGIQPGQLYA